MTAEELKEVVNCKGFQELACWSCPDNSKCKGNNILKEAIKGE